MVDGGRLCPDKSWVQRGRPPCENSLSPHNSGTVIDSENTSSSVNANRKSNMGFPTSHQRRSCVTPESWIPQNGVQMPKFVFFPKKFRQKTYKYATKFHLSTNSQRWSCSAISYLSNGINILAGDGPVPVKFGPTGRHRPPIGRTRVLKMNDWFLLCLARTVVEYLQITGSVQHIVNLWTIHNRQKMTEKQVSEQRSLEGSCGPN